MIIYALTVATSQMMAGKNKKIKVYEFSSLVASEAKGTKVFEFEWVMQDKWDCGMLWLCFCIISSCWVARQFMMK